MKERRFIKNFYWKKKLGYHGDQRRSRVIFVRANHRRVLKEYLKTGSCWCFEKRVCDGSKEYQKYFDCLLIR